MKTLLLKWNNNTEDSIAIAIFLNIVLNSNDSKLDQEIQLFINIM